jgi:hypothetical protein
MAFEVFDRPLHRTTRRAVANLIPTMRLKGGYVALNRRAAELLALSGQRDWVELLLDREAMVFAIRRGDDPRYRFPARPGARGSWRLAARTALKHWPIEEGTYEARVFPNGEVGATVRLRELEGEKP